MISLLACLILSEPSFSATRFDLGERLKQFDRAWLATRDVAKHLMIVADGLPDAYQFFENQGR